tara:strand:+ start:183 stop:470 length:288 start_codon:yes stop_codon:yes gene_type:complete
MKITSNQVRKIIREELASLELEDNKEFIKEANPDGTISDNEDNERDLLMAEVEEMAEELVMHIQMEASRIGGSFRSPGIKRQALRLVSEIIHEAR